MSGAANAMTGARRGLLLRAWMLAAIPILVGVALPVMAESEASYLTGAVAGDAVRGQEVVLDRATGNCVICHRVPVAGVAFQGDLGPDLAGIGDRLTAGQIRFRLVDQSRLNPSTLMPPYYRTDGLTRVAERFRGRPALSAQQIEDVVAWLVTLKAGVGDPK